MQNYIFKVTNKSKKIKKYTFKRPINQSRFQVYLVSKLAKRKSAKIYYAAKIFQSTSRNIYSNELQISKKFNHPNIIKLRFHKKNVPLPLDPTQMEEEFDVLFYENAPYGDLLSYLVEFGAFTEIMARTIFHKIVQGIEEMHRKSVVHLDIKPDNIVIGHNFEVKLIDFGHCKQFNPFIPLEDYNVGTPSYMPPELRTHTPYNGFQIDVFNLGIMLFCLLSAQAPFEVASKNDFRYEYIYKKNEEGFWDFLERCCLSKVADRFQSKDLKNLLFRMMSYNPADRPTLAEVKESAWMKQPILDHKEYAKEMNSIWHSLTIARSRSSSNTTADTYASTITSTTC